MTVTCIVSGGQTGADQAGLFAGRELGLMTAGYAPEGWRTEVGPTPWLADYNLVESDSADYKVRTRMNVQLADATVIFGRRSPGSNATEEFCRILRKPCLWLMPETGGYRISGIAPLVPSFKAGGFKGWLMHSKVTVLNVAGNRESKMPGIQEAVKQFLVRNLK